MNKTLAVPGDIRRESVLSVTSSKSQCGRRKYDVKPGGYMETVSGYFTTERNIRGLTTRQIEERLGFRLGRLKNGARILALYREPSPHQYVPVGSTLFPRGEGLNAKELERTKFSPGAWLGERLVKVVPELQRSKGESDPPSSSIHAEQWELTEEVPAREVCRLKAGETYWG
jgi:hypothetical protein